MGNTKRGKGNKIMLLIGGATLLHGRIVALN